jgi:hypothetical protein
VLRSKVAVFIDLWQKSSELTAQAMDQMALQDAVTKALALLGSSDVDGAVSVLRAAQAKHAGPRVR